MRRSIAVVTLLVGLLVGGLAVTSAPAAKKKPRLKDGTYAYTDAGLTQKLKISRKGTRVTITEKHFQSSSDVGGECDTTTIKFGTFKLKKSPIAKNTVFWDGSGIKVPAIPEDGTGGGTAATSGSIAIKSLKANVTTSVNMRNENDVESCASGGGFNGKLKKR